MTPHKFFLVIKARWKLAATVFGAIIFLCLLATFILPKHYTATASVVIDAKTDPLAGAQAYASQELLSGYVATQVDIIGSERVIRGVIKAMKLEQDPVLREKWRNSWASDADMASWLVLFLQKKVVATPSRDSNVINISVEWTDAKFAADMANAFANTYIETNIELKVEPARQYAGWFDQRSRALREELEAKQRLLSDLQAKTGITVTDEKLDIEQNRLQELSTQLVTVQGELQESQSRQHQVNDVDSIPEVLQSQTISDLKSSLADAESREPDIASRLGKNHPDYQAAEAEIASLRRRIGQETAKIVASLGNNTQINLRRESDLRKALEAQKAKVLDFKHQHDQVAVLESDVTTAQRDLDAVTQHRAESDLESAARQSNIVLLTAAVPPLKASSPKLVINLLLGIFVGLAAGLGTVLVKEIRQPLLREAEELTLLLGVPLLGQIGSAAAILKMGPRDHAARLEQLAT